MRMVVNRPIRFTGILILEPPIGTNETATKAAGSMSATRKSALLGRDQLGRSRSIQKGSLLITDECLRIVGVTAVVVKLLGVRGYHVRK